MPYTIAPHHFTSRGPRKGREAESGEAGDGGEERTEGNGAYAGGEVPGGVFGLDGAAQAWGGFPGVGGGLEPPPCRIWIMGKIYSLI